MVNPISHIFILLLLLLPFSACDRSKSVSAATSGIEQSDSIPEEVKKLVSIVAEDDSAAFSTIVSYPLSRPYPLKDIETSEQMRQYYSVLVDDSLKSVIVTSRPEDWEKYGWRGWGLKGGAYVWLDTEIYDVSYLSARERMMLDSLTARDMGSIEEPLRKGWSPVMCLKGMENGTVYRIDSSHDSHDGTEEPCYRMLVYNVGSQLSGKPSMILTGHKETEGSAGTATYFFVSDDGVKAVYMADIPDGSQPHIEFCFPASECDSLVHVSRAYWLDLETDSKTDRP